MPSPPTGTVTFLFTDIEGSTRIWEHNAPAMQAVLARHDEILRRVTQEREGYVFKTVGDAFCVAFSTAPDALEAALSAQRELFAEEWGEEIGTLWVRMALHMGAAEERDGDYFGPLLNRVARLLSAAHGGQVLLTLPTREMVRDQLPAGAALMYLGERRLKDLFRPERLFQLMASGLPSEFPPLRTLDAYRNNLPLQPKRHRRRQAEERLKYSGLWKDYDLVFPSQKGTPMRWTNLTKRNFKPLLEKAGLPRTVRFYDLRHTFATWMLEQGENPKIVQEILGHSQITHTMDTYSHVAPNMQREAFARLSKRLK